MNQSKDILAVNLLAALKDLLRYWYVLLISLFIMVGFTYLYLKYSSRTYRVGASIVLRIENNNHLRRNNNDILRAFDFIMQDKSFQNEIFYLQSLPLINEVIREMDLRTFYYTQDKKIPLRFTFGLQNIYRNSPIMVVPEEGNTQPTNLLFHVTILNERRFWISASGDEVDLVDFRTERITGRSGRFELEGEYNFGDVISNQYASFRVLLNSNYRPDALLGQNLFFRFNNLNQIAGQIKGNLSVNAQGIESTMAHLDLKTENVLLGMDFLNRLIETYIQNNLAEANLLANKTIEHIERQLEDVSGDLNLSERQLQNLRLNRNVMDIEDKSRNIYQQLQVLETRRDEVNRRLNHLRQMKDYFDQYKDSTKILAPSALGLNDPVLNTLITELTGLNSEKQRIISQDQMRNPRLATLNIRIENLKEVISENISFSLTTTRGELDDLRGRINALNMEFAVLPGTQRELFDIERRFKLNDATYTSLLEKRIQAQILKASKLPDAKIIEPPRYTGVTSPRRTIHYMMSVFLALVLPSGFIMGRKLIINRLSSREDIGLITNAPRAASIPFSANSQKKMVINNPQSALAEAFYMLRSNLVYYLHGENHKVILVTSSIPDEGKSFSSFNLATSFAFANSRTVLVEFDLRKPSEMMNGINTSGLKGLSSYLINRSKLEEIIIKTESPNLDIIPAGQIPPNPIELISSPKTGVLLEELRKMYDFVIVDTPPYGLLTDSFLLMTHADLNLFVTRLGYTKKSVFATNMDDLERKKVRNVYVLVNGDNNEMLTYGYGKYPYLKKESRFKLGKKTK